MKPEKRIMGFIKPAGFWLAAAVCCGCMRPEPAGPAADGGAPDIRDDDRLAGATSSTNWPPEDAGGQPVAVYGKADSSLRFTFERVLEPGTRPVAVALAGKVRLYRAGYVPVLDSVPALEIVFPSSDSFVIDAGILAGFAGPENDTLRFSVEVRSGDSACLLPGFAYAPKRAEFLERPGAIVSGAATSLTDAHYRFAGMPDPAFRNFLADTGGNARIYYYIAGSPYFWPHESAGDSLSIGPFMAGSFPLRCVRIASGHGPDAGYRLEIFPLSLVKETANDSVLHSRIRNVFTLGPALLSASAAGGFELRPGALP